MLPSSKTLFILKQQQKKIKKVIKIQWSKCRSIGETLTFAYDNYSRQSSMFRLILSMDSIVLE